MSNSFNLEDYKITPSPLIELSDDEWKEYWSFDHKDIIINYKNLE